MGYVSTTQQDGLVVSATKGLLVYAIITVPLVLVTMGTYFIFELANRRLMSQAGKTASKESSEMV